MTREIEAATTAAHLESAVVRSAGTGRPEQFDRLLTEPGEGKVSRVSKGPETRESQAPRAPENRETMPPDARNLSESLPPGVETFLKLKSSESGPDWHKQFRKNQEGYRKGLGEAEEDYKAKEKEFLDKMKPGDPNGLAAREKKAVDSINEKKLALEDNMNKVKPSDREKVFGMVGAFLTTNNPELKRAIKQELQGMGAGNVVGALDDFTSTVEKNESTIYEAETARGKFNESADTFGVLNQFYRRTLEEASRREARPGDSEELQRLGKKQGEIESWNKVPPKPELDLDFHMKKDKGIDI
ncbi:MAG: hypothetical protein KC777_09275 [Cyanobacteria bacterium HKST-UBA02]|nr:hypothetical protein [Cyanobacteria bacterium HKST-UBA02]